MDLSDNGDQPKTNWHKLSGGLLLGILWIVFSTVPSLYGTKTECVNLRIGNFYGGLYYIISILIYEHESLKNAADSIKALADLAVLITIWVFLAQGEESGALRTFIWVQTWIIVGCVSLSILFVLGCLCWTCIQKTDESDEEDEQRHEQVQPIIQTTEQNTQIEQNQQTEQKNEE